MDNFDDYIPIDLDVDNTYCHTALEASIRAVEDDLAVPPYIASHFLDPRITPRIASLQALYDLAQSPGFEVDVVYEGDRQPMRTPYGRFVKRGFRTNELMVQSSKGWLLLGHVRTNYNRD